MWKKFSLTFLSKKITLSSSQLKKCFTLNFAQSKIGSVNYFYYVIYCPGPDLCVSNLTILFSLLIPNKVPRSILEIVLSAPGCDINLQNETGETPLMVALEKVFLKKSSGHRHIHKNSFCYRKSYAKFWTRDEIFQNENLESILE